MKTEDERRELYQPVSMVSPYQVKLRSKTPSQFPSKHLDLESKIKQRELQLGHMKRGKSLFGLIREEQREKVRGHGHIDDVRLGG